MTRPETINGEPVIYESPDIRLVAPYFGDWTTLFYHRDGDDGPMLRVELPTVLTGVLRPGNGLRVWITRTDDS